MKENNKDDIYYLEQNKNTGNSAFNNEVQSLEFVQKIGNKEFHNDYKKRDSFLMKHGKQLFRKFKNKKPENTQKLSIKIRREARMLSVKDVDDLIKTVNTTKFLDKINLIITKIKWFIMTDYEWKIIISKNNIVYKFSLKGMEKINYNYRNIIPNKENRISLDKVLSDEEINQLLTRINEED
jgi:hypothetical protein